MIEDRDSLLDKHVVDDKLRLVLARQLKASVIILKYIKSCNVHLVTTKNEFN